MNRLGNYFLRSSADRTGVWVRGCSQSWAVSAALYQLGVLGHMVKNQIVRQSYPWIHQAQGFLDGSKMIHFFAHPVLPLGYVYEGGVKNRQMHGQGRLTAPGGIVYEGNFENGKMSGYGKLYRPNGSIYEGMFKDGQPHGHGKLTRLNGTVYEGELKKGKEDGYGKLTFSYGVCFEGEFKDGQRDGVMKATDKDGNIARARYSKGVMVKLLSSS